MLHAVLITAILIGLVCVSEYNCYDHCQSIILVGFYEYGWFIFMFIYLRNWLSFVIVSALGWGSVLGHIICF